jgi:ATP-dependent RNA helicase DDX19/DBP5
MNFSKPSRVQAETLPLILSPPYRNLVAQAHNGSGKTTCFVLGMLSRVDPSLAKPQALCICPTRELVVQNVDVLTRMAKHTKITCASSAAFTDSAAASRMPPIVDQIVIGTPGRTNSWIARKSLPAGYAPSPPPLPPQGRAAARTARSRATPEDVNHIPTGADSP